jgi:hypothetical protein
MIVQIWQIESASSAFDFYTPPPETKKGESQQTFTWDGDERARPLPDGR